MRSLLSLRGALLAGLGVGALPAVPATGEVQFYTDPAAFEAALAAAGKVSKAFWDFKPHDAPSVKAIPLDDPLDINTHGNNPDDPWTDAKGGNLWPAEVDNVQFTSNQSPQGPLVPRGLDGLAFLTPGFAGNDNNALLANVIADSFDIISGLPAGDNHTAIGLELILDFTAGTAHVTVYDKDDLELAKLDVNVPAPPGKAFLGILRTDRETIGRIDIWDSSFGAEGISSIALYQNEPGADEGCSPGYWKQAQHFDSWPPPYTPDTLFADVFEDAFPGLTLLEVLKQGGGGLNALGRQTVAALLNAASPDVGYPFTPAEVIAMFNDVFPGTDEEYEALKDILEAANEAGCPLNGFADVNADGLVDIADLLFVLSSWSTNDPYADCNHDGVVGIEDLLTVLAWWGA